MRIILKLIWVAAWIVLVPLVVICFFGIPVLLAYCVFGVEGEGLSSAASLILGGILLLGGLFRAAYNAASDYEGKA